MVYIPGEFRETQNWIAGTRPGNAAFVSPPPEKLMECAIAELERSPIAERTVAGLREARRKGERLGRPCLGTPCLGTLKLDPLAKQVNHTNHTPNIANAVGEAYIAGEPPKLRTKSAGLFRRCV